jgi:Tol biopolymer transport system component
VHDRKKKKTRRVSVHTSGSEAGDASSNVGISADGRFVVFSSLADDLIDGDDNGVSDIFVHDRKKKKTRRVSVRSNGAEANGLSSHNAISANGRFIAFSSNARNLAGNENDDDADVFVHDRVTKKTRRVSIRSNGAHGKGDSVVPSISANGRFVAFRSDAGNLVKNDTNGHFDIFVHDRVTKKTRRVSVRSNGAESDSQSTWPAISANGRYVAFESSGKTLIANDTNDDSDVFVHDRARKKTRRVSVRNKGGQSDGYSGDAAISAKGRHIAFASDATNLIGSDDNGGVDVFVRAPLN